MPSDPRYTILPASSKFVIPAFLVVFVGHSRRISGPRRILRPRDPLYTTLAASSNLMILGIYARFRGL